MPLTTRFAYATVSLNRVRPLSSYVLVYIFVTYFKIAFVHVSSHAHELVGHGEVLSTVTTCCIGIVFQEPAFMLNLFSDAKMGRTPVSPEQQRSSGAPNVPEPEPAG